jgi:D-galactarolactone cycloisomerase
MKIVAVTPHVLSTPLEEPFAFSRGWVERRGALVVEVATDEGKTGWGGGFVPRAAAARDRRLLCPARLRPMLVGRDPFDVEVLWEEVYNRTRPFGGAAAVNAISGVDVVL